jgi:hypothetical protein
MLPTVNPAETGPLIQYLKTLALSDGYKTEAREAVEAIKEMLATPQGKILLDLMQKAVIERLVPTTENSSALACRNAQAFIAHDLRRIMNNELDALFEQQEGHGPGGRRGKRG